MKQNTYNYLDTAEGQKALNKAVSDYIYKVYYEYTVRKEQVDLENWLYKREER